ncbi:flagellar biosynthesis, cell-distal portion of basal-body rod [Klebsiella pneumoniae]|uniref:Flagellar biosynthesis, cell-distal portion of basal-body rod n=1 Tax=Klebsiella pneumoniae TaxID=573 RepID=A0A378H6E2_KLEPN|nr:flagellar biosynthesis, cell-distal portion of basal-body rod [Klebsiella pneumoniae]
MNSCIPGEVSIKSLIPLSKQYMTLAAAQADIVNIPVNSTTYVRSPDGSALADEYMNVAGTLTATGRRMPSQQSVDEKP